MRHKNGRPAPPKSLSPEARRVWRELTTEFVISDSAGYQILKAGLESYDRAIAAKSLLDAEGTVVKDRWGQSKIHPGASIERDSRAAFLSALKQLNLDCLPARPGPGRPGGS